MKHFLDNGIYLKPHLWKQIRNSLAYFPLTSANKPQTSLVLYLQVWRQSLHKMLVKFNVKMIGQHICERKRTNGGRELTNYLLTETLFLPKALLEEIE